MKRVIVISVLGMFVAIAMTAVACSGAVPSAEAANDHEAEENAPMAFDAPPAIGTKAKCPVMEETFVVSEHSERSEYNGKHYAYCCPGCKAKFDAAPGEYLQ